MLENIGKRIRIERIIDRETKRAVIVPMDHGISVGPIDGIVDLSKTVDLIAEGGATGFICHKGLVGVGHRGSGKDIGLIVHLSASTEHAKDPNAKVLVCSVEKALSLGADSVSIHLNIGADTEGEMIRDFSQVSTDCVRWGVPLLAMVYPRGPRVKNPFDVELVKHATRLAAELGADIVKTVYTGSIDTFKEVTRGCPIPVIIAGGPKIDSDQALLQMVYDSVQAGGIGTSIGRNIFQHRDVVGITRATAKIILNGATVEEAMLELKK